MPKAARVKVSEKLIHPNSRRSSQLTRCGAKDRKKIQNTKQKAAKLDATLSKLLWFKENSDPEKNAFSEGEVLELIERYINRYKEELEQIEIVQNIAHRSKNQHASRQLALKALMGHEKSLLTSTGFEAPDLLSAKTVRSFRSWDQDPKSIPNLHLRKYVRKLPKKS